MAVASLVLTSLYLAKLRGKARRRLSAGQLEEDQAGHASAHHFDDGFHPAGCPAPPTVLPPPTVRSERLVHGGRRELVVVAEALEPELAHAAFDFSAAHGGPWGTYLQLDALHADGSFELSPSAASLDEPRIAELALQIVRSLLEREAGEILRPDLDRVHGFGVWSLVGGVGRMTEYHMDYAEMYRRKTGILRPPLHGITLQLSPVSADEIEGGTFGAHVGGLRHYAKYGYKCRLAPFKGDTPTPDWGCDAGWRFAPFAFNQATVCAGDLPHAASRIMRWPNHTPRIVIGINTFTHVEGPTEALLPQHSAAFRRAMKLQKLEAVLAKLPRDELARILHATVLYRREKQAIANENKLGALAECAKSIRGAGH